MIKKLEENKVEGDAEAAGIKPLRSYGGSKGLLFCGIKSSASRSLHISASDTSVMSFI